ncbi:hypothetical protein [Streptomyces alboflavus]|uniref:hypothetical protein n=1 Tax=Streptomyces alboflavus TaxID=67267 RepID=UPI000F6575C5|nr:hypothetical protein [Streptomyces alboflavus]
MTENTFTPPAEAADDPLRTALDLVRAWRHRQPHTDAPRYLELDAILDAAALDRIEQHLAWPEPTSLPEAVTAYRGVLDARRRILADVTHAWDLVEAAAVRNIARFMPRAQ